MDKADTDFLSHLFKENNQLRTTITNLTRKLHNATVAFEEAEIENTDIKVKLEHLKEEKIAPQIVRKAGALKVSDESKSGVNNSAESKFIIDRQEAEIIQMGEDLLKTRVELSKEIEKSIGLTKELTQYRDQLILLEKFKEQTLQEAKELLEKQANDEPAMDGEELLKLLQAAQIQAGHYKVQILELAKESNLIQNAQQNQLQGVQALMDDIRQEYEEFITITKIENESYQERRKAEYNALKKEYDDHKSHSFEEKKRTMMEYQNILSSMQSQYDEYRTTTEILFNMEMVKLDEEIGSQATRYEQESMYIIQAKDKFYMDMMVTKDSKIMGLIEGSDLQSLMQKHELDMENIRKEHSKDIERVKSEHESESKNVMLLLQRQNVSLESKTEKLQSHLKSIESRMKELMNTIDMKNKQILEKDDVKTKLMIDHQIQIEEYNNKLTTVMTEKERLRHKVIRLTLNAKGEGENSIESMLKRLSNDTTVLRTDYESMEGRYSQTLGENQEMLKKLREKEKMIQYFKSEVTRRSQEYKEMTNTFEDFLSARAKQNRKDKSKKLAAIAKIETEPSSADTLQVGKKNIHPFELVKVKVPDRNSDLKDQDDKNFMMMDRGKIYLKRFKNLSKAFETGEFRATINIDADTEKAEALNTPLYQRLMEKSEAIGRIYEPIKNIPEQIVYAKKQKEDIPGTKTYTRGLKRMAASTQKVGREFDLRIG